MNSRRGSSPWVRDRLAALSATEDWTRHPACDELVGWIYTVVQHRANRMPDSWTARSDVTQDAMTAMVRALRTPADRDRIARRDNPAAVLERVAERAVDAARHVHRMAGFGGVAPNGRNWHKAYPLRVGTDEDIDSLAVGRDGQAQNGTAPTEEVADLIRSWAARQLGVTITRPARDATIYVLDRMFAGLSRTSLMRGGHSALGHDPAMQHLGISSSSAHAFGCWLLGRPDGKPPAPGVLDLSIVATTPDELQAARWRRLAVTGEFGQLDSPQPPRRPAPMTPGAAIGLQLA